MKKITILGGGNMGFTYATSIYNSDLEAVIHILENAPERIEEINALNTVMAGDDLEVLKDTDVLFLAVKPQVAPEVFQNIKPYLNQKQLVVSFMAGVSIETIQKGLGLDRVVRAMPNLPAQVKLGMTTYVGSSEVGQEELALIASVLGATGKIAEVPSEEQLDRSIGISGSGPGFVFYFMDAMEKSAMDLGFSSAAAKTMVAQTFEGAVALYKQNSISLESWMGRVSSKGGTTIAGLDYFEEKQVGKEIQKGIQVCVSRAFELGEK